MTRKTSKTSVHNDLLLETWGTLEHSAALLDQVIYAVMLEVGRRRDDGATQKDIGAAAGVSQGLVSGMLAVLDRIESGDIREPDKGRVPGKDIRETYGLSEDLHYVKPADGAALITLRRRMMNAADKKKTDAITSNAAPISVTGLVTALSKPAPRETSASNGSHASPELRQFVKMTGGAIGGRIRKGADVDNETLTPDQVLQVLSSYALAVARLDKPADQITDKERTDLDVLLDDLVTEYKSANKGRKPAARRTRKSA